MYNNKNNNNTTPNMMGTNPPSHNPSPLSPAVVAPAPLGTTAPNNNNNLQLQQQQGKNSTRATTNPPSPPYRRWLTDRIRGKSKYGNNGERPMGSCCWVPPAVGWCPSLWEDNICCQSWGRMGCFSTESSRFVCMHLGFVVNVVGCFLMAYGCVSISQDYSFLSKASLGSIEMTEINGKFDEDQKILLEIGLRAIALDNPFTNVDRVVIGFDTFCESANTGMQRYINPSDCDTCYDQSLNMVISAILAVISFLPTFCTDILRMYSGYDVNCQKACGTFFSLLTVGLVLNVILTWKTYCGDYFYKDEIIYLDRNGDRVPQNDPTMEYAIDSVYSWGWGMMAMIAASGCKFLEALCHFCVPTPTVTRDLKEQYIYEVIKEEDLVYTVNNNDNNDNIINNDNNNSNNHTDPIDQDNNDNNYLHEV